MNIKRIIANNHYLEVSSLPTGRQLSFPKTVTERYNMVFRVRYRMFDMDLGVSYGVCDMASH